MITSIFPLLLALVSCFLVEKKITKDTPLVERVKISETLGEFMEFVA
jgi:hypothetical protein